MSRRRPAPTRSPATAARTVAIERRGHRHDEEHAEELLAGLVDLRARDREHDRHLRDPVGALDRSRDDEAVVDLGREIAAALVDGGLAQAEQHVARRLVAVFGEHRVTADERDAGAGLLSGETRRPHGQELRVEGRRGHDETERLARRALRDGARRDDDRLAPDHLRRLQRLLGRERLLDDIGRHEVEPLDIVDAHGGDRVAARRDEEQRPRRVGDLGEDHLARLVEQRLDRDASVSRRRRWCCRAARASRVFATRCCPRAPRR